MTEKTLTYSDNAKGWTSFHSFVPDWMAKLNNRFFSIKDGQLYLHNDETNPIRNNFYGIQYGSKITTVINEANSEDKIFKNIALEGNKPWNVAIKTNLTEGTIASSEFNTRESRHFAHTRGNENTTDLHGNSAQGIGVISVVSGTNVSFTTPPLLVGIGDELHQLNGSENEKIGTITNINLNTNTITVNAILKTPMTGLYSFSTKNSRVEGSNIRGYYAELTLENNDVSAVELFAIESNIVKSHV